MSSIVKKITLTYQNNVLDPLWVILDNKSAPPILPLLFSTQLSRHGVVYETREIIDETSCKRYRSLVEKDVSDKTIRSYIYCLSKFLSFLEHCRVNHQTPGMHNSSACSQRFVNHYINQQLANNLNSHQSLNTHLSALVAYFNWLSFFEICPRLDLRIHRKTRQLIAEKSNKQHYIQYVSRYWYMELLNACETLAEKLMMRMGLEVGLRTSELTGLHISGKNSLINLFEKLNTQNFEHFNQFRYNLEGRYTKGAKSRWIYFDRTLLEDLKRYFLTERQWIVNQTNINDPSLFLRTDQRFIGTGIGKEQASRVFRKRSKIAGLNSLLSFHDLRHTFATNLFHSELVSHNGRETRSESAALIVVAQRLGHEFGKDGHAPAVTTRYIRMRLQMLEIEESFNV